MSVPLAWDELNDQSRYDKYTVRNLLKRLSQLVADPWHEMQHVRQALTVAMRKKLTLD